MTASQNLAAAVAAVKRARFARVVALAALKFLLCAGIGYSAAVYASAPVATEYRVAVFAFFLLVGCGAGIVSAWKAARGWKARLTDSQAAELLAGGDAELANVLIAGEDLARWDQAGPNARGADPALVRQAVEAAEAGFRRVGKRSVGPPLGRELKLAAVVFAAVALASAYGPKTDAQAVAQLVSDYSGRPIGVGDLSIALSPPAYTALPVTVEQGGGGDFSAYPGTRAEFKGTLSEQVDSGVLVAPDKTETPVVVSENGFSVGWVVAKSGMYNFKFYVKGIELPVAFEPKTVTLLKDSPPEVELLAPVGDVDAMNVDEIKVAWRAKDDFGAATAALVLSGATEVRIPLRFTPGKSVGGEAVFLPAAHPGLGEGAYLSVEVKDNDSATGPKAGTSRSVYLTFTSARKIAEELSNLEDRLIEAMLNLLADHLENPAPEGKTLEGIRESSQNLIKLMGALLAASEKSKAAAFARPEALENFSQSLSAALDGWLRDPAAGRGQIVEELEKDIIFLDSLKREMKMEEALSLGDELSILQRDLFDRLNRGEDTSQLLEAVNRIEKTLAEIAKKLADKESLPDDFANADAAKDPPKDALTSMLEELKKALRDGDRKKAAELAEQILKELDKWMENLQKAADGGEDSASAGMKKKLDELSERIAGAMAEQERILGETKKVGDELSRRAMEKLREKADGFLQKQRSRLDEISRLQRAMESSAGMGNTRDVNSPDWAKAAKELNAERTKLDQALRAARIALEQSLGAAGREAEELAQKIDAMQEAASNYATEEAAKEEVGQRGEEARQLAGQMAADIRELLGKRKEQAGEKEKSELASQGKSESELASEIGKISDKLKDMAKGSPLIDPAAGNLAGEAGNSARSSAKNLGDGDPFSAVPSELATLEKLTELGSKMDEMKKQMESGKRSGRGKSSGRRQGGREGMGDADRGHVEIPGESESEQLRRLREEVMKSMGEGRFPKEYQKEIERYFEGLIK